MNVCDGSGTLAPPPRSLPPDSALGLGVLQEMRRWWLGTVRVFASGVAAMELRCVRCSCGSVSCRNKKLCVRLGSQAEFTQCASCVVSKHKSMGPEFSARCVVGQVTSVVGIQRQEETVCRQRRCSNNGQHDELRLYQVLS